MDLHRAQMFTWVITIYDFLKLAIDIDFLVLRKIEFEEGLLRGEYHLRKWYNFFIFMNIFL
jgi:hypothetical protein